MACCRKPQIEDLRSRSDDPQNSVCVKCKTHWHRGVRYTRREWESKLEQAQ